LLRSLLASGELERELRESLLTAEAVVGRVLQRWHRKIEAIENPTLRQRADDVLDLGRNVIRRLRGEQGAGFQAVPEGSILVARQLLPSDIVLLPRPRVAAVVVEALGHGSHAALLAREKAHSCSGNSRIISCGSKSRRARTLANGRVRNLMDWRCL
jgi:phosphoenolpyruvate-protein kinase (PTS system EI component)